MKTTNYTSESQQRVLKTMLTLFGHEIDGLAPGQIARLVGSTPSNATRDLANLVHAGIAERVLHNDHYRLTPMLAQKAMAILTTIDRAVRRVDETRNRYTSNKNHGT